MGERDSVTKTFSVSHHGTIIPPYHHTISNVAEYIQHNGCIYVYVQIHNYAKNNYNIWIQNAKDINVFTNKFFYIGNWTIGKKFGGGGNSVLWLCVGRCLIVNRARQVPLFMDEGQNCNLLTNSNHGLRKYEGVRHKVDCTTGVTTRTSADYDHVVVHLHNTFLQLLISFTQLWISFPNLVCYIMLEFQWPIATNDYLIFEYRSHNFE
jgi:hypothetical protein